LVKNVETGQFTTKMAFKTRRKQAKCDD